MHLALIRGNRSAFQGTACLNPLQVPLHGAALGAAAPDKVLFVAARCLVAQILPIVVA